MADTTYDLVVLGAGPGGYVAAIRAGQLGMRVAVVEKNEVGGVCLNWGCIPSKSLLRNAEIVSLFERAHEFGISYENAKFDFGAAIDRSRKVVRRLTQGVSYLLKKNNVEVIKGVATLRDAYTVQVEPDNRIITTGSVIVATGARQRSIPPLPIDGEVVITSREALELREIPKRVVIVGAGATGVEFAYLYRTYGAEVTLVEMLPRLLPNEDEEISDELRRTFEKRGIRVVVGARVERMSRTAEGVTLDVIGDDGAEMLLCDKVLSAVGAQPNSDGIGLEEIGVTLSKGMIQVDERMATSVKDVYAIGDVTGILPLAHVAMAQGVAVVERLAGLSVAGIDYNAIPRATYCQPQVASFGLTEKQAREQGKELNIGRFSFRGNGKALALGETDGMAKMVADAKTGEILGMHLIGSEVTEMLGELSLAHLLEGTTHELGGLIHAHPTLSEIIKEAALDTRGEAIHQ